MLQDIDREMNFMKGSEDVFFDANILAYAFTLPVYVRRVVSATQQAIILYHFLHR